MNILIFTPSSKVEKLKQKARKLKKASGLSHNEALDQVAKEGRYNHWHHVTEMAAMTEPSETAYRNGLLVAFDMKEAESFNDEFFVEARFAPFLLEDEIREIYAKRDDDDEDFPKPTESEQEMYFQEFMNDMVFLRYTEKNIPSTMKDALKLISEYSMWIPEFTWLKGKLCDNYDSFVIDDKHEDY